MTLADALAIAEQIERRVLMTLIVQNRFVNHIGTCSAVETLKSRHAPCRRAGSTPLIFASQTKVFKTIIHRFKLGNLHLISLGCTTWYTSQWNLEHRAVPSAHCAACAFSCIAERKKWLGEDSFQTCMEID